MQYCHQQRLGGQEEEHPWSARCWIVAACTRPEACSYKTEAEEKTMPIKIAEAKELLIAQTQCASGRRGGRRRRVGGGVVLQVERGGSIREKQRHRHGTDGARQQAQRRRALTAQRAAW